jgi:hypothetical protein
VKSRGAAAANSVEAHIFGKLSLQRPDDTELYRQLKWDFRGTGWLGKRTLSFSYGLGILLPHRAHTADRL